MRGKELSFAYIIIYVKIYHLYSPFLANKREKYFLCSQTACFLHVGITVLYNEVNVK